MDKCRFATWSIDKSLSQSSVRPSWKSVRVHWLNIRAIHSIACLGAKLKLSNCKSKLSKLFMYESGSSLQVNRSYLNGCFQFYRCCLLGGGGEGGIGCLFVCRKAVVKQSVRKVLRIITHAKTSQSLILLL